MKAESFLKIEHTILGEGPVWDYRIQKLWWVDIKNGLVHCTDPLSLSTDTYAMGQMVGMAIPCDDPNYLIVGLEKGLAFYDLRSQSLESIIDPEPELIENRFNDGKCDPAGRLWAGTMRKEQPHLPLGSLYFLDTHLQVSRKQSDIHISNGLAWTAAGDKMFYIDTVPMKVYSFDYDNTTGEISNQKVLIQFEDQFPDGMCIDENDNLWIAFCWSGKVECIDTKTGKVIESIPIEASGTTSCAFGGKDLDTLFITTYYKENDPLSGALFKLKPGVKGRNPVFFKKN